MLAVGAGISALLLLVGAVVAVGNGLVDGAPSATVDMPAGRVESEPVAVAFAASEVSGGSDSWTPCARVQLPKLSKVTAATTQTRLGLEQLVGPDARNPKRIGMGNPLSQLGRNRQPSVEEMTALVTAARNLDGVAVVGAPWV